MEKLSVDSAALGYGLAALVFAGFALQLRLGGQRGPSGFALMLAIGLSAIWAVGCVTIAQGQGGWFSSIAGILDTLRVLAWFAFLVSIVDPADLRKWPRLAALGPARSMAVVALAFLVLTSVCLHIASAIVPNHLSTLARPTLLISLVLAVFGLVVVEQVFRSVPEHARWSVKPLCLGLGGMFAFDLYVFADGFLFGRLDWDLWAARGMVNALVIPFVAVSAARNRDWRINIHLSRRVVFRSTALLCSGIYLLIMAAAGYYVRYFGGSWGRALQVAFLFFGMLVLLLLVFSGTLRSKLRVFVSKHFFSYRYDYREEWLRFTQALADHEATTSIRELSIKALADLVESPGGVLWLRAESRGFSPVARWNMPSCDAEESVDGGLATFLGRTGWVISLDEYRDQRTRYDRLALPEWLLADAQAWLVLPLNSARELIGFVVLARSRAKVELDWEVNDLLKTAGRQAATFLGQVQAAEALLEARKFESFNRLSAFVVHDIKNLVAQMSLLLKNAERHSANPEFQKDMLVTVGNVVERMNRLLMQLRAGVTPIDPPQPVDLSFIAARIRRSMQGQRPSLVVRAEPGVFALGHSDRLERVVGHLVQNSIDATTEEDQVWVRIARDGDQALVEVGDTGHGMSQEFIRDRLFKPFQTTKSSGMGIGAFESQQYVKELGGRIEVCSQIEVGTRVTVRLPGLHGGNSSPTGKLATV